MLYRSPYLRINTWVSTWFRWRRQIFVNCLTSGRSGVLSRWWICHTRSTRGIRWGSCVAKSRRCWALVSCTTAACRSSAWETFRMFKITSRCCNNVTIRLNSLLAIALSSVADILWCLPLMVLCCLKIEIEEPIVSDHHIYAAQVVMDRSRASQRKHQHKVTANGVDAKQPVFVSWRSSP